MPRQYRQEQGSQEVERQREVDEQFGFICYLGASNNSGVFSQRQPVTTNFILTLFIVVSYYAIVITNTTG